MPKKNESAGKKQEYRNKKRENYGTEDKMYATHMVQGQMMMMMKLKMTKVEMTKLKTIDLLLQPLKKLQLVPRGKDMANASVDQLNTSVQAIANACMI